jgi:hypothetical protein
LASKSVIKLEKLEKLKRSFNLNFGTFIFHFLSPIFSKGRNIQKRILLNR